MQEQLDRMEGLLKQVRSKLDLLLDNAGNEEPAVAVDTAEATTESPPSVRFVMDTLESIRGYPSGKYAQEAKAVKQMIKQGYEPSDMFNCYAHLKEQHFWTEKTLTMTSVAGQIGEWKAHSGGMTSEERMHQEIASYDFEGAAEARKADSEHQRELREAEERP